MVCFTFITQVNDLMNNFVDYLIIHIFILEDLTALGCNSQIIALKCKLIMCMS